MKYDAIKKAGGEAKILTGQIIRNEDRSSEPNNTTIVMTQTEEVPFSAVNAKDYSVRMILEPAGE